VYPYLTNLDEKDTLDALIGGRIDAAELIKSNAPMLGWNAMDVNHQLRPTEADVAGLGPNFKKAWDKDFKNKPNRPLALGALLNG
jgi:alcohol oxidase